MSKLFDLPLFCAVFVRARCQDQSALLIYSEVDLQKHTFLHFLLSTHHCLLKERLILYLFCGNRHEKSGNELFLTELSNWVFHERGHLKVSNFFL